MSKENNQLIFYSSKVLNENSVISKMEITAVITLNNKLK